jgi:3-deoxy-D-manno-octulosonic-acid transferase
MRLAALFHPKARLWVEGRRSWRQRYAAEFQPQRKVLWVHAASLGEFEQGRPVIEQWRQQFTDWQIVLTFYSPSGYELRKHYPHADYVCYLPADTRGNVRDFLDWLRPDLAIFIKYEFWPNYLHSLHQSNIATWLIAAAFRPEQPFFKSWGGLWRNMLRSFQHFFVQDNQSMHLLQQLGLGNRVSLAGDTRIDRVLHLADTAPRNAVVDAWNAVSQRPIIVIGSSWPADEAVIFEVLKAPEYRHFRYIIAPHEPSPAYVEQLGGRLSGCFFLFSDWQKNAFPLDEFDGAVVDSVGLLNTLYQYGTMAYIGGGFGKGIHNTLEPAAYGLPVIFGPNFHKFEEARQLIATGGGFSVKNAADFRAVLDALAISATLRRSSQLSRQYLLDNSGATMKIIEFAHRIVD